MKAKSIARLHIRSGILKDARLIRELIEELAAYERLRHECVIQNEDIERWVFGSEPKAEVLIAEWDQTPVAFALYFYSFSTFLGRPGIHLEDLFVRPSHRGKGIGKALLKNLAKLAIDRGCGRLEWSVLDWNNQAIGFYEKLGAKAMSDWTTFRLSDGALEQMAAE